MPTVLPVKFRYISREMWFDPHKSGACEGDHVICATERGTEIGLALRDPFDISDKELTEVIGNSKLRCVVRIATENDLQTDRALREKGEKALPIFRRLVREENLDIKPVAVEYLFGGEKTVCYFVSEERVDFRSLVRSLAHELHERIDMRQINVREEAGVCGGLSHCGQEFCCSRLGCGFDPVSIHMAKDQDLSLNSAKISGVCGRLMCCLRYEVEAYRDFKMRAPKRGSIITTPLGSAKTVEYNTPKEHVVLSLENDKRIEIPLALMDTSKRARRENKGSEEPCRPDCVSRQAMETLSSFEIGMALADIDYAQGENKGDCASGSCDKNGKTASCAGQNLCEESEAEQVPKGANRRFRRHHKDGQVSSEMQEEKPQKPTDDQKKLSGKRKKTRRKRGSAQLKNCSHNDDTSIAGAHGASTQSSSRLCAADKKQPKQKLPENAGKKQKTSKRRRRGSSAVVLPQKADRAPAPKPRRRPGDKGIPVVQHSQQSDRLSRSPVCRRRKHTFNKRNTS